MAELIKTDYRPENDLLYITTTKPSAGALEVSRNIYAHFDEQRNLVAVEVLWASESLRNFGITRKMLIDTKDAVLIDERTEQGVKVGFILANKESQKSCFFIVEQDLPVVAEV